MTNALNTARLGRVDPGPGYGKQYNYAADATLTAEQDGSVITNLGAVAAITLTLPAAVAGIEMQFIRYASYKMTITPDGTDIVGQNLAGESDVLTVDGLTVYACIVTGTWNRIIEPASTRRYGWPTVYRSPLQGQIASYFEDFVTFAAVTSGVGANYQYALGSTGTIGSGNTHANSMGSAQMTTAATLNDHVNFWQTPRTTGVGGPFNSNFASRTDFTCGVGVRNANVDNTECGVAFMGMFNAADLWYDAASIQNGMVLRKAEAGPWELELWDDNPVLVETVELVATPAIATNYNFEFQFDAEADTLRCLVNGSLVATVTSASAKLPASTVGFAGHCRAKDGTARQMSIDYFFWEEILTR